MIANRPEVEPVRCMQSSLAVCAKSRCRYTLLRLANSSPLQPRMGKFATSKPESPPGELRDLLLLLAVQNANEKKQAGQTMRTQMRTIVLKSRPMLPGLPLAQKEPDQISIQSTQKGMIPSGTGIRLPKPSDQSSGARPFASQGAGLSGLASLVPPRQGPGLTGLASMVFQQHRRAARPPKPLAMQQSSGRATLSQPQLPVLSNPHGPASFPYFKEGFMTQPFSVSAFEAESKVAFAKLEDFLAEAAILQEQGEVIEAASLRVAPLEEQRQAAVQAVLAHTKATRRQASMRQASPQQTPATAAGTAKGASVTPGETTSRRTTACPPTPAAEAALLSETSGSGNAPGNPAAEALPTSSAVPPPIRSTPAVIAESPAIVEAARPGKGPTDGSTAAAAGRGTGQSSAQSPAAHSGARVAAAAQEHAKAHAEAQKKAEAEVQIKWQEGLDEAAKGLKSVRQVSNPSSKAADRRWSRNLSANTSSTPGETADRDSSQFSAAGSANLFSPAATRGPAQEPGGFPAEGCSGHSGAKACQAEQAPLLPRPPDDVVLTFCIHRFDRPGWKLMDVAVLSSQKLTALKDVIKCEADANMKSQRQDRPNGYFYIEGDFYNDMRDDGTDLSLDVRQFCRDRNISVPAPKPSAPPAYPPGSSNAPYFSRSTQCEPRTRSMEDTTFNDLFLRVGQGAGYVYVHQGCCEHLLELTDVRRAHDADPLLINYYPVVLDQAKWTRRHCCICNPDNKGGEKAKWVTHNDKNAPSNPAFWCDGCYRQMHYNDRHDLQYTGYVAFPYRYELGTIKQQNKKDADATEECNDED
ncbi:hypothetical protein WJX82_007541 [Trebouxia sp. C0006]